MPHIPGHLFIDRNQLKKDLDRLLEETNGDPTDRLLRRPDLTTPSTKPFRYGPLSAFYVQGSTPAPPEAAPPEAAPGPDILDQPAYLPDQALPDSDLSDIVPPGSLGTIAMLPQDEDSLGLIAQIQDKAYEVIGELGDILPHYPTEVPRQAVGDQLKRLIQHEIESVKTNLQTLQKVAEVSGAVGINTIADMIAKRLRVKQGSILPTAITAREGVWGELIQEIQAYKTEHGSLPNLDQILEMSKKITPLPKYVRGLAEVFFDITNLIGIGPVTKGHKVLRSFYAGGEKAIPRVATVKATEEAVPPIITREAVQEAASPPIGKPVTAASDITALVGDIPTAGEVMGAHFVKDRIQQMIDSLESIPGFKVTVGKVINLANPIAHIENVGHKAMAIRFLLRDMGKQKVQSITASWMQFRNVRATFGKMDDTGTFIDGPFKGKFFNDIRNRPNAYVDELTLEQRKYIDLLNQIDEALTDYAIANGIDIVKMHIDEGAFFAGRRVWGKVVETIDGPVVQRPKYMAGARNPRLSAQKHRQQTGTMEEAVADGLRYLPDEEALMLKAQAIFNRVSDERAFGWLLDNTPWMPSPASIQKALSVARLGAAKWVEKARKLDIEWRALNDRPVSIPVDSLDDALRSLNLGDILRPKRPKADILGKDIGKMQGGIRTTLRRMEVLKRKAAKAKDVEALRLLKAVTAAEKNLNKYSDDLDEVLPLWQEAVRQSSKKDLLEATVDAPGMAGKILTGPDAQDIAETIRKTLDRKESEILRKINKPLAFARFIKLGGDASLFLIQGIWLLGQPITMSKMVRAFVRGMLDPEAHAAYIARNQDILASSPGLKLAYGGGNQITEAIIANTGYAHTGAKILKAPMKVIEPFARGWEFGMDMAGIELKKSLRHMATDAASNAQVDAFVNEFRGIFSASRLGVSPLQQQIEGATLLASQYNRAIAALALDLFRGNIRGRLARRGLARGAGAISLMMGALYYAKYTNEGVPQKDIPGKMYKHWLPVIPKKVTVRGPDGEFIERTDWVYNPDFQMIEIAGQRVGPGSKMYSILNILAKSAADPDTLLEVFTEDWMSNPALRFIRSNLSIGLGKGLDLLTGEDFMGDLTREGGWSLEGAVNAGKTVGESFVPLWISSALWEGRELGRGSLARGAADFWGLKGFEQSRYAEWLQYAEEAERNLYETDPAKFQEIYPGLSPQDITADAMPGHRMRYYQKRDPQGKTMYQAHKENSARRGRANEAGLQIEVWNKERMVELEEAETQFAAGQINAKRFREIYKESGSGLGSKIDGLKTLPKYKKAWEELEDPPRSTKPDVVAYWRLMRILTDNADDAFPRQKGEDPIPLFDTIFGYDYRAQRDVIKRLENEVGPEVWKDVLEIRSYREDSLPQMAKDLIQARKDLEPYWDVFEKVFDVEAERLNVVPEVIRAHIDSYLRQSLIEQKRTPLMHMEFDVGTEGAKLQGVVHSSIITAAKDAQEMFLLQPQYAHLKALAVLWDYETGLPLHLLTD